MALLEIAGLTKRYGDLVVLDNVGLAVDRGEIVGLIGPNGSGKTTLLECLAGLLVADAGHVLWNGAPLVAMERKSGLFYLPDGIAPFAEHSVQSVLSFFAAAYSLAESQAAETVAMLGLGPVLGKPVGALSKGFRRRLLLAVGLLTPHPLLVMDEPFDGFDLHQTREIARVLRHLVSRGRSLLLAIHQLTDAERICDRFVLLAAGRVRGTGTLANLRRTAGVAPEAGLEEVFLALT
jgi:ABC-2 type transport system ATP-binding protein